MDGITVSVPPISRGHLLQSRTATDHSKQGSGIILIPSIIPASVSSPRKIVVVPTTYMYSSDRSLFDVLMCDAAAALLLLHAITHVIYFCCLVPGSYSSRQHTQSDTSVYTL